MIEVKNIAKEFNGRVVLKDISFTVPDGQSLAIIGPSGCGKTTLLRIIVGLLQPDQGDVIINGRSFFNSKPEEAAEIRRDIGLVFQMAALFDSLTVYENVGFAMIENRIYPEEKIRRIVAEKLALVDLAGTEDLYPDQLSGGMKKRVGVARALATSPRTILYDEPTTGLDPTTTNNVENLIHDLHQSLKVTSIIVTHYLLTVYKLAERILLLYNGELIDAGSPAQMQKSSDPLLKAYVEGKLGTEEKTAGPKIRKER